MNAVVGGAGGAGSGGALAGFAGAAAGESIFSLQNLTFSPTSTFTVSGSIADGALASVPATGTFTPGSGNGIQISKNNSGTLILQGINTYSGGTVINQGALSLEGANGQLLPTGFVDITGSSGGAFFSILSSGLSNQVIGDLRGGANGVIVLGTNQLTFGTGNTTAQTFAGIIEDSGTLFKQGSGTEIFSGSSVFFTGSVTIAAGKLELQGASSCLPNASISITSGTLQIDTNQTIQNLTGASGTFISLGSGAQLTFGTASSTVVASQISGAGSIKKTGSGTVSLTGSSSYSGGTTLNQGTLSINGDAALGAASGNISVTGDSTLQLITTSISNMNRPISISDGVTFTIDTNGLNLTEAGIISSGGGNTGALTKIGGGTLTLTGASTYGGNTTISAGTLTLAGSSSALPNTPLISIASGATFATTTSQTVHDISGVSGSFISLGAQLTFGTANPDNIASVISGTGPLKKTGTGTATLTGNNTYTGGTILNQGTLNINADAALGAASGTISVSGNSTLQLAAGITSPSMNRATSIADGVTFTIDTNGFNLTQGGVISSGSLNTGSLTKVGAGILALTGQNSYGGGTTISAGTVSLQGSGILAPTGFVSVASGGTFDISVGSVSPQIIGDLSGAGDVTLGPNALQFGTNNPTPQTFSGVISDSLLGGSIIKAGTGTEFLSGTNTYTGGTTLKAGILKVNTDASLGASGTGISVTGSSTLQLAASFLDMNRPISISDGVTFTIDTNGFNLTEAGIISSGVSNTGILQKISAGVLTLSGANTYGGGTIISGGSLSLGVGGSLLSTGSVFVGSGAVFDISPGGPLTQIIGDLTGSGSITLGQNTLQFGTNNPTAQTFSGVISDASLGGSIIKAGTGTANLTGNSSYTGSTTLANGTLAIGQNTSIGASGIPLFATGNNVTLVIGYTGNMDHPITITTNDLLNLQVDSSFTATITAAISETAPSAQIQKTGGGELVLSVPNSYTGQTSLASGILTLSGASNCISSSSLVSISAGATLNVISNQVIQELTGVSGSFATLGSSDNLSFTGTGSSTVFAGVISGAGSITKTSSNLAVFTGANTYTGGTTISGGKLSLQGAQGRLNPSGAVDVASGTFDISLSGRPDQIIGDLSGSGSVTLGSNILTFGTSTPSVTFGGVISGSGAVIKEGSGTAIFTGANLYTGGTRILRGTLSLGPGGSLDASGAVAVGEVPFVFAPVFDISSGGNQVIGKLTGTAAGTIHLGANQLTFGTSQNATFRGSIQDTGSIVKQGSGTETFTGSSSFSGGMTIQDGVLLLTGSFTSPSNAVVVDSGATLAGTGSIAGAVTVNDGAIIAPGASPQTPGTLTVGSLTLSNTSNTLILIQPQTVTQASAASEIIVNGPAAIKGTLSLYALPGFYPEAIEYTIVSASSLTSQPFAPVVVLPGSQNLGNFTVLYNTPPGTVILNLSNIPPPVINTSSLHCGPNPVHVANYLNQLNTNPVLGPIIFDLSILPPDELCEALNSISPARNATGIFVSQNTMFLIASTVSNRMTQQRLKMRDAQLKGKEEPETLFAHPLPSKPSFLASSISTAGKPTESLSDIPYFASKSWGTYLQDDETGEEDLFFGDERPSFFEGRAPRGTAANIARSGEPRGLWAEGLGEWISQEPGRGNPGYHSHTGGGLLGFDYYGKENGQIGAAICYAKSRVYQTGGSGENTVDYYAGTIYGTIYLGDGYIEAGLAGAYNDFSNTRRVRFPESGGSLFDQTSQSSFWGAQLVPHLGGGCDWNFGFVTLEPFIALDCDVLYHPAFSETGENPLNMQQTSSWSELFRTEIGFHAYELFETILGDFILRESLSYVNKQPFHIGKINANIVGFPPGFTVDSFNNNQNFISPSLQILYRGPKGTFVSASYMGEFQWGWAAYMANSLLLQLGAYF